MILGDLLDAAVRDESGRLVGYVSDARLVLDGPPPAGRESSLSAARLHGLIVTPRRAGSFLGYERNGVGAPWPLARWLRWRHRGTFLIHWTDVFAIPDPEDPDRVEHENVVVVRDGHRRYDPALRAAAGP